jgi:hypothetical protein
MNETIEKKYYLAPNLDGSFNYYGHYIKVEYDLVKDGKLIIKFNKVSGHFDCSYNNLTTLEGTPKEVGGDFYCSYNKLTSLKYAPEIVGRDFDCDNNRLITLKGAPNYINGYFTCANNKLKSLKYIPKQINGVFFYCFNNPNLIINKLPKSFKCFICNYNQLNPGFYSTKLVKLYHE